jgi:hypothetical protein
LQGFLCRVYGFARSVKKVEVTNLQELVGKDVTEQFVSWCINDRKHKGATVLTYLGMLNSVVKTYAPLAEQSHQWLPKLISELPRDPESLIKERKGSKWVRYDELAKIPDKIRCDALGGHFKTGHRWAGQNRPMGGHPGLSCFILPAPLLASRF